MTNIEMSKREELSDAELDGVAGGRGLLGAVADTVICGFGPAQLAG
jgi:hypothetical protein